MSNFLKYGAIAALLQGAYSIILFLLKSDLRFNGSLAFGLSIVVPVLFMVLAVKAERKDQEGLISFGEGLKTSFLTYLVYIILSMILGYVLMQFWSADDWSKMAEFQRNMMSGTFEALGMDQVQIDEQLDQINAEDVKAKTSSIGNMLVGVVTSSIFGLILSLIISAIMKKNPTP